MAAKILIAHGDTAQLDQAVRDLMSAGYEVVATPDGGDAFARFFEEAPDLVVASESLPVLDGRSFFRMIRSQSPALPVVLLTQGPPAGGDEFPALQEPLDVGALERAVPTVKGTEQSVATPDQGADLYALLVSAKKDGSLLSLLDEVGLRRLAGIAQMQEREPKVQVIREGDACDGFYMVVTGQVRVTLAERGDEEVAHLGPGEFFGEMALLSDQPRAASVWTLAPSQFLFFRRQEVVPLLNDYPRLKELLGGMALQRAEYNLWQALHDDDEVQHSLSGLLEGVELPPAPGGAAATPPAPLRSGPVRTLSWPWTRLVPAWHTLSLVKMRHQFATGVVVGFLAGAGAATGAFAWLGNRLGGDSLWPRVEKQGEAPALLPLVAPPHGPTPEPTEPAAAAEPTTTAPAAAIPTDRKTLRGKLLEAYQDKRYADAVTWGGHLRARHELDWEALFVLANAERMHGDAAKAGQDYLLFVQKFAGNVYASEAQFYAAEVLLELGDREQALALWRAVAANPKSNLRKKAQKRLETLE